MRYLFLVGFLVSLGCADAEAPSQSEASVSAPSSSVAATDVELVPRDRFFDNPERVQGRISPDGKWLSWIAPLDGVLNVWVAPVDHVNEAKPITYETTRGIRVHYWDPGSAYIMYAQDQGGDENFHIYAAAVSDATATGSNGVRDLTPVPAGARARIISVSRDRPGKVLVGLNDRDATLFDLYEVDIASGERHLVAVNPGYTSWVPDETLTPRLARRPLADGGSDLVRLVDGEVLATFSREDALTSGVVGFDATNEAVYMHDSRGRDVSALVKMNVATGDVEVLAQGDQADIGDLLFDPVTREVIGYAQEFERVKWHSLNETGEQIISAITEQVDGDLNFVSSSADGNRYVVAADSATRSSVYYLFDRTTSQVSELFVTRPALANVPLVEMHPLVTQSRDGLTLVSYLTLPAGSDADGDGRPEQALPTVLFVHGGPWSRDTYGYNSIHQWLSNRGYAVLSVNYRGSTGFGKNFLNAAAKEFSGKMHDDLLDVVQWAIDNKVSKADEVAIMGASYGGYATLVGLTFTPDTFACGVDIVGPSNLVTLIESFPAYWGPNLASTWFAYVGNPTDESERADMYNRSPIARVDKISVPLLIGQGENDPRVTKLEADQIVAEMQKRGLPVTYLNYPDEGHGFARPENRLSFNAVTEAFLSQCLNGRYQPIGSDFKGSSIQVLHGAQYVPGLNDPARSGVVKREAESG